MARLVLLVAIAAAVAILTGLVSGRGASGHDTHRASAHRLAYLDRIRDAVVHGAATDFAIGTGTGGPAFEECVQTALRGALDAPTVDELVALYGRPFGTASAAHALNRIATPLAAGCGHRSWMPELVEAARGLRSAGTIGAAIEKLGVTYGPYMGMRCRHAGYGRCGRVGIDVVFGQDAISVLAITGCQTLRLRTPGQHNRIRNRDWVGTFTAAELPPRRSGRTLVHVPVERRVHFADGSRARAFFPHVLVSSGWG